MWYFAWILGLGFACTFATLNAMWFEIKEHHASDDDHLSSDHDVTLHDADD